MSHMQFKLCCVHVATGGVKRRLPGDICLHNVELACYVDEIYSSCCPDMSVLDTTVYMPRTCSPGEAGDRRGISQEYIVEQVSIALIDIVNVILIIIQTNNRPLGLIAADPLDVGIVIPNPGQANVDLTFPSIPCNRVIKESPIVPRVVTASCQHIGLWDTIVMELLLLQKFWEKDGILQKCSPSRKYFPLDPTRKAEVVLNCEY